MWRRKCRQVGAPPAPPGPAPTPTTPPNLPRLTLCLLQPLAACMALTAKPLTLFEPCFSHATLLLLLNLTPQVILLLPRCTLSFVVVGQCDLCSAVLFLSGVSLCGVDQLEPSLRDLFFALVFFFVVFAVILWNFALDVTVSCTSIVLLCVCRV